MSAIVLCALLWALPAAQALAQALRVVVSTSYSMPFGKYENDRLVGGLLFDLGHAVAQQMQMPVDFVELPRKRIDAASIAGDVDLRCNTHPDWTPIADQFAWTEPLFEVADVVFAGNNQPMAKEVSELKPGAIVSTVLGYSYPTLEREFSSGQLKREDTVDQEKVLLKVGAGRTPYGISNVLTLDWHLRTTPRHGLAGWRLTIARTAFHCAVPKASPVSAAAIIDTLNTLKKNGRIEAILRNYR